MEVHGYLYPTDNCTPSPIRTLLGDLSRLIKIVLGVGFNWALGTVAGGESKSCDSKTGPDNVRGSGLGFTLKFI